MLLINLYIQEKTKKSFFEDNGEPDDKSTFGRKHVSIDNWGEQMTKTSSPGIVVVDFKTQLVQKGNNLLPNDVRYIM